MSSFRSCLVPSDSWYPTIARLALGIVVWPHGMQKVFGWFSGNGFEGTMGWMTESLGIPWLFAFAAVLAESLFSTLLILGFAGRLAAFIVTVNMAVAALLVHLPHGWFSSDGGYEYHILMVGLGLIVMIGGSGKVSVDAILTKSR